MFDDLIIDYKNKKEKEKIEFPQDPLDKPTKGQGQGSSCSNGSCGNCKSIGASKPVAPPITSSPGTGQKQPIAPPVPVTTKG